jgi:hypothetical protein
MFALPSKRASITRYYKRLFFDAGVCMAFTLYRMPPLPVKIELLRELLAGPHKTELFVGATGKPVFGLIMSSGLQGEDAIRFYEQILRLVAETDTVRQNGDSFSPVHSVRSGQAVFQLQPNLWVDLNRYEVRRGNECLSLRAREAELLRILLAQPCCFIRAEVLADAIGSESAEEPEHPIEEMVSTIRQKLGEIPYHPKLLRCKRYAGYAIFPGEESAAPQNQSA